MTAQADRHEPEPRHCSCKYVLTIAVCRRISKPASTFRRRHRGPITGLQLPCYMVVPPNSRFLSELFCLDIFLKDSSLCDHVFKGASLEPLFAKLNFLCPRIRSQRRGVSMDSRRVLSKHFERDAREQTPVGMPEMIFVFDLPLTTCARTEMTIENSVEASNGGLRTRRLTCSQRYNLV